MPTVRLLLTRALARASGIGGMVGGQMLDLAGEGRFGDREPVDVARLQQMKTGALLRYGCIAGAILGQASQKEYQALDDYGRALGEAFQIADDLLDVEGDAAALGKPAGRMRRSARPPSSPSSASTAPSSACATCWRAADSALSIFGAKRRRAARRRALRRRTQELEHASMAGQGRSRIQRLARFRKLPMPVRVVYARPRTFIALAHRHRRFLPAAGLAAAGDAAADRLGRLRRALSRARLHHDVPLRPRSTSAATPCCRTTAAS